MRFSRFFAGVIVMAALPWTAFSNAQVADADNEPKSEEPAVPAAIDTETPTEIPEELLESRVMEEIEVIAGPQGRSAFELEMQREAQVREAIYAEMRMRKRREEELAWRQADPHLEQSKSRIKWGYSPQAEQRMRRENDYMYALSIDQNKPATIISVEF
jgi:hypothetical protein